VDPYKPAKIVKDALDKAVEKVATLLAPTVPGAPGSEPPPVDPPMEPRGPLPRKADQASPATVTPVERRGIVGSFEERRFARNWSATAHRH